MKEKEVYLSKKETEIKEILKQYDGKVKAYAVLDETIESIRKIIKRRK